MKTLIRNLSVPAFAFLLFGQAQAVVIRNGNVSGGYRVDNETCIGNGNPSGDAGSALEIYGNFHDPRANAGCLSTVAIPLYPVNPGNDNTITHSGISETISRNYTRSQSICGLPYVLIADTAYCSRSPLIAPEAPAAGTMTGYMPLITGSLRVTEYRLTTESCDQYDPSISGVDVVFTQADGTGEIFRCAINGEPEPLVQGPGNQYEPDLWGSTAVYTNDVTGLQDVWLFDWMTQENYKVTTSFMPDYEPAISGENIVFTSHKNFNEDIYWYNTGTGSELPIANTSNTERFPAIDGELVAWVAYEAGDANVYARYLEQPPFPVATTVAEENFPSVSGSLIAYRLDTDVAVFDVSTGITTRVTEDAYTQNAVRIAGSYVFFSDNRNGNFDVFMHDLFTGVTYPITNDPSDQNLSDADQNRAVYYDSRYGSNDIFAAELTWNQPPVADAGDDQSVAKHALVQIDGTDSSDPDNDPLADVVWTFESRPPGSAAMLDDPHSLTPSFVADRGGDFILSLMVYDGELWSDPDVVVVTATNQPPVADAGEDQTVEVGDPAQLNAVGSSDPDSDPITGWSWTLEVAPPGSAAALAGAATATPTLTPDVVGSYVISLVVYDGEDWSAPDWVTIVAELPNLPPVADAGPDQQAVVGETVYLSGSGYDPEGQPIAAWHWSFLHRPDGSMAILDDPEIRNPTFVPDLADEYMLSLIVSDGVNWSEPDGMTVTAEPPNQPPVAEAGGNQYAETGELVQLDGSGSYDPDNDPIVGWRWQFDAKPPGSAAALSDSSLVNPTFVPDLAGGYLLSLIVFDGEDWSAPDAVAVYAGFPNQPPVADAGEDQIVEMDDMVQLDGTGSHDPDNDPIAAYRWRLYERPPGSLAEISDTSSATPVFLADQMGDYRAWLEVSDGEYWSAPDTVLALAEEGNVPPIADAGDDQEALVGEVVQLDGSGSFDPESQPIVGWHWQFDAKPGGSQAELSDAGVADPTFLADMEGQYSLSLIVSDGELWSLPDNMTVNATIASFITVSLKTYLQGPFNGTYMNTDLTGLTDFPTSQPYSTPPWNYNGTESVTSVPSGTVDWVLVELRDATSAAAATAATAIARQAAFLMSNGSIRSLDGTSNQQFDNLTIQHSLFAVIYHRNHLAVMSANPMAESGGVYSYDFTTSAGQAYNSGQKELGGGYFGMYSADGNADGTISTTDKTGWTNQAAMNGYTAEDFNLDAQVNNIDKNDFWIPNVDEGSQVPE